VITSHQDYLQAREALRELEEALFALRRRLGDSRAELFAAMAQDYIDSINGIRQEIDVYIGIMSAQAARAPLWLGLEGAGLSSENIRTSLLAGWLERLRKSVIAVADFALSREATRGRRPQMISEAYDFRLVGFQSGSLKIGLEVPEPEQLPLFGESSSSSIVRQALIDLLERASEVAELQRSDLRVSLSVQEPSPKDAVLLKQLLRLIPGRRERVRAVVLEGALVPRRAAVRLDASLRPVLAGLLSPGIGSGQIEEIEGTLREIDLDRLHFILRERPENLPDVTVFFPPTLLEDAKRALDRRVRVEASPESEPSRRFRALVIEVLEETPL
jgi:hypothetical protein